MPTQATWKHDMEFQIDFPLGESITLTSLPADARPGPGPSPVEAIQAAVAGCTGMDIVLILKKMRKTLDSLRIEVNATRRDEQPRIYTDLELVYYLEGPDLDPPSVIRAVTLSMETYCSVSAMLQPTVRFHSRIFVNGEAITAPETA